MFSMTLNWATPHKVQRPNIIHSLKGSYMNDDKKNKKTIGDVSSILRTKTDMLKRMG